MPRYILFFYSLCPCVCVYENEHVHICIQCSALCLSPSVEGLQLLSQSAKSGRTRFERRGRAGEVESKRKENCS